MTVMDVGDLVNKIKYAQNVSEILAHNAMNSGDTIVTQNDSLALLDGLNAAIEFLESIEMEVC